MIVSSNKHRFPSNNQSELVNKIQKNVKKEWDQIEKKDNLMD
jgi:hypothetical protein